jgi:hypothetical protein
MGPVLDIGLVETPSSEGWPQAATQTELATIAKIELQVCLIAPRTRNQRVRIKHSSRSEDNGGEEGAKESMCSSAL